MGQIVPRRPKVIRFCCESLGQAADVPSCENVEIVAVFQAQDGTTGERATTVLVYPRIMCDPQQFPP
jgi:hypothetical protein